MNKRLSQIVKDLPTYPGVYVFEDDNGYPLYIGKSINIKDRVKSHIYASNRDLKESKIVNSASAISFIKTAGELGALIRESLLVKQLSPLYNRKLRRYRTLIGVNVVHNQDGYNQLQVKEISSDISPELIGKFLHISHSVRDIKFKFAKLTDRYNLCPKLMGLEHGKGRCFYNMLKKCYGACVCEESVTSYNSRFETAVTGLSFQKWPYPGEITVHEMHIDLEEEIKINNWCIDESSFLESKFKELYMIKEKYFDLDTYRILRSFLINSGGAVSY